MRAGYLPTSERAVHLDAWASSQLCTYDSNRIRLLGRNQTPGMPPALALLNPLLSPSGKTYRVHPPRKGIGNLVSVYFGRGSCVEQHDTLDRAKSA